MDNISNQRQALESPRLASSSAEYQLKYEGLLLLLSDP